MGRMTSGTCTCVFFFSSELNSLSALADHTVLARRLHEGGTRPPRSSRTVPLFVALRPTQVGGLNLIPSRCLLSGPLVTGNWWNFSASSGAA